MERDRSQVPLGLREVELDSVSGTFYGMDLARLGEIEVLAKDGLGL